MARRDVTAAAWSASSRPSSRCSHRSSADGHNGIVQFSADLRDRVADGTITVSYRLWSRPQVKVGGVYRSTSVMFEIDEMELVPFSSITDEDLAQTGEPDLETLRRRAAHSGPVHDDTLLYRVEFHVVDAPPAAK
jgi:hypothetical protein